MKEVIVEKRLVGEIVRHLPRRPAVDGPAEVSLADFDPRGRDFLAVAVDGLSEEIATGLYADSYTIGWMAVMSPMSDLAAAGARPLGVSVMLNLPVDLRRAERAALARGMGGACRALGTVALGGDTNVSGQYVVGACAIGLVSKDRVVTRAGARAGDLLYLSGRAGLGNAYALSRFDPANTLQSFPFRPQARLAFGELLGRYASCSMDTSDGVIATLDELSRVNGAGFVISESPNVVLDRRTVNECIRRHLPPWMALAGCHGEFEIVCSMRPASESAFLAAARKRGLTPVKLGRVVKGRGVSLAWGGKAVPIDSGWLRNRAAAAAGDVEAYIRDLARYAAKVER